MNSFAANPTGSGRFSPARSSTLPRLAYAEDPGWPMPMPPADKKPVRPTELWVPGRHSDWWGTDPTLQ